MAHGSRSLMSKRNAAEQSERVSKESLSNIHLPLTLFRQFDQDSFSRGTNTLIRALQHLHKLWKSNLDIDVEWSCVE